MNEHAAPLKETPPLPPHMPNGTASPLMPVDLAVNPFIACGTNGNVPSDQLWYRVITEQRPHFLAVAVEWFLGDKQVRMDGGAWAIRPVEAGATAQI